MVFKDDVYFKLSFGMTKISYNKGLLFFFMFRVSCFL